MSTVVTVAFDRSDVVAGDWKAEEHVLCLTPSAFDAAVESGLSPIDSILNFTDRDHARCVAAVRRALREFDAHASHLGLSPAIETVSRQGVLYGAGIGRRLLQTIRHLPARVRDETGRWCDVGDAGGVLRALFPRIIRLSVISNLPWVQPISPWLYRILFRFAARRATGSGPVIVTSGKLKLGFATAFSESGVLLTQVGVTSGDLTDYRALKSAIFDRIPRLRVSPVADNDPELCRVLSQLKQIESAFSDQAVRTAWRLYLPLVRPALRGMLGLERAGKLLFRHRSVIGAASYEANGWASAALFDAAHQAGREAIVLNHNCHSLTGRATADAIIGQLYLQRKHTKSTTTVVHWAPGDLGAARKIAEETGYRPRELRCRIEYPVRAEPVRSRFKVLHAANYQNWSEFFPWIAETSDEFVRGIRQLSAVAAEIQGLDLIIRVRPKAEVDANVIRKCIAQADNVSVCTTDEDFIKQLHESDLLISFFSTTVMQALQMGKPVLLWGSAHRFQQVPARRSPPTHSDRGAVYAVERVEGLRGMLTALRDHHHDRPLTDSEVAQYRFDLEVGNERSVTRMLTERVSTDFSGRTWAT